MKRIMVLMLLLCVWQLPDALAGAGCSHSHAPKKRKRAAAKTTLADPAEDHYDIKYLLFHLNVTDTATHIDGNVATTAQVVASSMSEYVFELGPTMNIDSAKIDGALLPVVTTGSVRRISLPSALATGTVFTAQVWYHGTPPSGSGFFNGVTHAISSGGTHMVYTISDPWVALNWWPCKQSVLDQADSVDMFVTVPDGVVDGSNGVLVNVDNTSTPGYTTFHWQTHYPIDYYLISLAVARYAEYKSYWHFSGSPDSVLIQNFFLDTATFNPVSKVNFDSIGHMVDYFSSLFGRYPFWQEKYGVCFTNLPGGMEHQTMTTIGVTNTTTIAHELTHQWFGDHVTYRTWGDMWLSEGFATFSEQLYLDHFWGADAARDRRAAFIAQATSPTCGRTYVDDTTTSDSLFTVNQYQRAAMIINTLRYMAPEDSLFFKVLRNYQSAHSFGNAATSDFKAVAESVYGFSLDTFFNQWIYGRGYPRYRVSWNQVGSTVYVKLMQSQSCSSATDHFSTPVEVNLRAGSLDTFIRVYNSIDTQVFSFEWPETVSGVYLNTNAQTLLRQLGTSSHDTHLGFYVPGHGSIQVHPNPASDKWEISNLAIDTRLTLIDLEGRNLWSTVTKGHSTQVPGQSLPTGNYFLRLENSEGVSHIKLSHW